MLFIETRVFTRQVTNLLSDEQYILLQQLLFSRPRIGSVIRGGGGLRKVRWSLPGQGKSGEVRIIYFLPTNDRILLLFMYRKTDQADLTREQLRQLGDLIE